MRAELVAAGVAPLVASAWPRVPENSRQGVSGNFAEVISWGELATVSTRWEIFVFAYDFAAESPEGTGPDIPFGFTGREHDASGLRYHRDRYVDPSTGRWLQPDRLGLKAGPNQYQYVRSTPTAFTDSTGRYIDFDPEAHGGVEAFLAFQYIFDELVLTLPFGNSDQIGWLDSTCQFLKEPGLAERFRFVVKFSNLRIAATNEVWLPGVGGQIVPVPAYAQGDEFRTTPEGVSLAVKGAIVLTPMAGSATYSIKGGPRSELGFTRWSVLIGHELAHLAGVPQEKEAVATAVGRLFEGGGPFVSGNYDVTQPKPPGN